MRQTRMYNVIVATHRESGHCIPGIARLRMQDTLQETAKALDTTCRGVVRMIQSFSELLSLADG
jgi:hypothetical protein